ncbi:MAG: hypothetical protein ACFCUN_01665 [Hyphomicrobiaceae bacterium]
MINVEVAALLSVARASGFVVLALFCLLIGTLPDLQFGLSMTGHIAIFVGAFQAWRAWRAPRLVYKDTEAWLMLDQGSRPPPEIAQRVVAEAIREAYVLFARHFAMVGLAMMLTSLVLSSLP